MEGITKNVERIMNVISLFAGCGGLNIDALSPKVALLHFCTKEFRKRSSDIQIEKDIIVNSIVDNNGYEYDVLDTDIQKAIKILEREGNEGKLKVETDDWVCYNNRYREWKSNEVIDNDNKAFKDNTFNKNPEINKSHITLLENSDYLYNRVMDELNSIHNMLIELKNYEEVLFQELDSKYDNICKRYKEGKWKDAKYKLKLLIFETLNGLEKTEEKKNAIELLIKKNRLNYSSTEKDFVATDNPALYLFKHRKEISEDEMYSLIQARFVEETLESIKTYFNLKDESNYNLLFTDLASCKFVTIILPSLVEYDKYENKYQRISILLACHDLGLTKWDSNQCVSSFHQLVNEALKYKEDKTSNARTYQTYYSKLSEKRFHILLNKDNITGEEKNTIDNLRDGYHFALSTLCLALGKEYPPYTDLPSNMKKIHAAAIHPNKLHDKNGILINHKLLNRYRMVINGDVKEYVYFNNN